MDRNLELRPKLSLCMIVKNESQKLPRCLEAVKSHVDEMMIVDTGSIDDTVEIAQSYGAKVEYFQWCDDFAAARNYAISKASGEWILMLDADEQLVVESTDFLAAIAAKPEIVAYLLPYTEAVEAINLTDSYRISLFRNIPELRYVGRFHEELKYDDRDRIGNAIGYLNGLKIFHYGFGEVERTQKNIHRNIPILERIRQEEGLSLKLLYCLAEKYRNTEQPEKAQECYAEAFDRLFPNLMTGEKPEPFIFIPSLMYAMGIQSLPQKDYETVKLLCQRGLEWTPNYPPLMYLTGALVRELGFSLGAIPYFQNCLQMYRENSYYTSEPFDRSFMTTYPAYELGSIYINLERPQEALSAFEMALSFDSNFTLALEKINQIEEFLASQNL